MPEQTTQRPGPQDLFRQMGVNVYREAYDKGMSLSSYLEQQDPSDRYKDGLDAFGRLMKAAGIKTRAFPHLNVWADTFDAFNRNEHTRALFPEWLRRRWLEVSYARTVSTRSTYMSEDQPVGTFENPYIDSAVVRQSQQIAPAIPIDSLVSITTPITGDTYRMTYLTVSAAQLRLVRVGESAEIPTVKLATSDKTVDLYKFGRALESSYESLRRVRIDKIARHIQLMAVQSETDKLGVILDILVNGDGSAGSGATNFNLTSLDSSAAAGTLTLAGWIRFKMKFANPYMLTTMLAQEDSMFQVMNLNVGSANTPLVTVAAQAGFGGFQQINTGLRDNVAIGWTSDAPSLKLVGFDSRFAVERVVEIGANISEVERFTRQQIESITFTEVEGFAKIDNNSVKTLDINA